MDFPARRLIFIVLLVSVFLLWSPQLSDAQENDIRDRPVLIPDAQTIDTLAGRDFELTCRGIMPIDWELPRSSQRNDNKVSIDTVNLPDGVVKSVLTVRRPTGLLDTGRYKCRYTTSPQEEAANDGSRYVRSVYVFVNDPANFFTNDDDAMAGLNELPEFVTINEGKPSIIPCRPTYSEAKVELLGQNNQPLSEDITYDPTIGFTVLYPNVFFSGAFTCRFKVKIGGIEKRSDKRVELYYFENTDPPIPHINTDSVRHVATGNDFSMVCEVHIRPEGLVSLKWTFPSSSIEQRVTTVDSVEDKVGPETGRRFKAVRKTLTVRGAKLTDAGDYTCSSELQSNIGKVASQTADLKIYPGNSHVVLLVPKPRVEILKGSPASVYVSMDAHPDPRLQWFKDGRSLAVGQGRITRVGFGNMTGIQIVATSGEDAGNYTLVATSLDERAEANITLIINEPPTIELKSNKSRPFFMHNARVEFHCEVTAYPAANVDLYWAPCSRVCLASGPDGGDGTFQRIPHEQYSVNTDITGRVTTLKYARVMIGNSGFLRCIAENNFNGHTNRRTMDQRVLITDVDEGFQATMMPLQPVQHENVTFVCKANNYEYSYAKWERQPLGSDRNYNSRYTAVEQLSGIRLATGDVDDIYSHVAILRIDKVQPDMEGQYRCVAGRTGATDVRRSNPFELQVRGASAPAFLQHVNDDVEEKNLDYQGRLELDCEATGEPVPQYTWTRDGRPVQTNGAVTIDKGGARLINAKFTHDDQGQYVCIAHNPVGEISKVWKVVGGVSMAERQKVIAIVGGSVGGVLLIVVPILIFCLIKWREQRKRIAELQYLEAILHNDEANPALIDPNVPLTEQVNLLPYDANWEFPREKLTLMNKILGTGQFGKVVKGQAYDLDGVPGPTIVAVKMLKETADIIQRKSLLGEIKIMMHIGQNLNVVNLLGAITKNMSKGEIFMMMEFCPNGSLREYLQRHQGHRFFNQVDVIEGVLLPLTDEQVDEIEKKQTELKRQKEKDFDGRILTTRDLICYAFQVSRGMEYLASHHVIHRDLAARNVLVADDNVVKICDFGLARQEYSVYTKKNVFELPVKWMAVESIYENTFSTESDVWSFGILLWELFTLGSTPYPGLNIDQDFVERVRNGYRMERPYLSSKQMYDVMKHCWEAAPKARPTFGALNVHLGSLLEESVRKKYMDLNIPYEAFNESHQTGSDYVNDQFHRRSKDMSPMADGHGPVDNKTYVPTYKVLPGHHPATAADVPTKPKRTTVRPTGARNALDAMELQPMLERSPSPNPSRPGNMIENEDYLNDQFVTMPINRSLHNAAAPSVTYKPSFSDHSSGFHSDVPDDVSPVSNSRSNYLFNQNNKKPGSSEV